MAWATDLAVLILVLSPTISAAQLDGHGNTVYEWTIVVLLLAIIGLLMVLIIEIIIVYNIVKLRGVPWRSIWLGQMLLFGIFLSYLTMIAFIFKPTEASCGIVRFALGVCYALMLAVLFVKVLIILSPKTEAGFLKFGHQLLILCLVVFVQIIINSQWLILSPSTVNAVQILVFDKNNVSDYEEGRVCSPIKFRSIFFDFLTSFVFIIIVRFVVLGVTLKTYVRSKKAEGTANDEAKWILLTTTLSTVVWLLWILIGAFLESGSMASLAIGLWATATVKLLIMFIPKLHKLATLKQGEFYYEDELPGMRGEYYNQGVEIDPDPEQHSTIGPPSYQAESVLYAPSVASMEPFSERSVYERSPSVILEERSNASLYSAAPSLLHKNTEKVHFVSDPNALELQHPTVRSGLPAERYSSLERIPGNAEQPSHNFHTIGGHGHRGPSSVIGVPRYDQRYGGLLLRAPRYKPVYVAAPSFDRSVVYEPRRGPASVIGAPRYDKRRFARHSHLPVDFYIYAPNLVEMPLAASPPGDKGAARYESRLHSGNQDGVVVASPKSTSSLVDMKVNGSAHNGYASLPRQHQVVFKQTLNGKLVPVEQRPRAYSEDMLERRSVYCKLNWSSNDPPFGCYSP